MDSTIVIACTTLIGGAIGYFISFYLNKLASIQSQNNNAKRENYKKYVSLIVDMIAGEKVSTDKEEKRLKDNIKRLYDFYKDYILYASPEVIKSLGDLMQYLYSNAGDSQKTLKLMSAVFVSMRTELGLNNKTLGTSGESIFRAFLTDYDKVMT